MIYATNTQIAKRFLCVLIHRMTVYNASCWSLTGVNIPPAI